MSQRTGTRSVSRPAMAAVTNEAAERKRKRTPAPTAE